MDLFVQLPHAQFDYIPFPVTKVTVTGGLRHYVHEYPKSPGGAPEKLGRKLYVVKMTCVFDANLLPPWNLNGNDLWPGALSDLFDRFEDGLTSQLMIPTVGPIMAMCTNWSKEMEVKSRRTGEMCELEFLEDQSAAFLVKDLISVRTGTLVTKAQVLQQAVLVDPKPGPFSQVLGMLGKLQRALDSTSLSDGLYLAQVEQLVAGFQSLDATLGPFDQPGNIALLEATLEAWAAAKQLEDDILAQQSVPLIPYVVPRTMTVVDVANDLYGDPERGIEIMQINAIPDPLLIPRGFELQVYAPVIAGVA